MPDLNTTRRVIRRESLVNLDTKQVAVLCYKQGWRDRNLITMVAICGAESNFNEHFHGKNRIGLFGLHATTDELMALALNPPQAAQLARKIYEADYFNSWPSFQDGNYFFKVKPALEGISNMFVELYNKKRPA